MKKMLIMAAAALFMISCGSDDSSPVTNNDTVLVKKITETDEDGTLITVLTYNGTKLTEINNNEGLRQVFIYAGDLITEWKTYQGTELITTDTYVYNSANKLVTYTSIDNTEEAYHEKITYVHNADGSIDYKEYNGNTPSSIDQLNMVGKIYADKYTEVVSFGAESITYTVTFTFDGKNNPLKNVTGFDKIAFVNTMESTNHAENITSETSSASNSTSAPKLQTTYVYTYDAKNYPLTVVETDVEDPNTTITTQYAY
ncbi:putative periplasmic lipoprotein [Flavobacterium cerinum]|uniref:DUF4595 domain-containing protein n=1 Tax=Flavobacterium cerinum TaxID=2502784 RepID=A0A444HFS4_9FLAO|nr:hypothetical protein [Flavobacterium cerinum]RWX03806.1 hypothetical protein EPI11_02410 [Flavobacterium cerinum]